MTNLSKRFLRGRPMRLETSATLTQILTAMSATPPDLASLRSGWGSIDEDPDLFGTVAVQPPATTPAILPAVAGRRPDLLAARLYWFYENTSRVRGATNLGPRYGITGTDVLISDEGSGSFLLVVATLNAVDIDTTVIPAVQAAVASIDPGVIIKSLRSSLHFEDADFFLWMVRQAFAQQDIGTDIEVDGMDRLSIQDALDQQTSIARGVNVNRVELLTLLASSTKVLGPTTLSITVAPWDFSMEFQLALNGEFDISVKSIKYKGVTFASTAEMRLQAVTDLIFVLLPSMKAAYEADTTWRSGVDRDAFRAAMKARAVSDVGRL